ncbi:MAG: hypothetical protein EON52_04790, partial [Actinomycetales bacterium]
MTASPSGPELSGPLFGAGEPPISSLPVREGPTFESLDPRTGDVVGEHAIHSAEEVEAAVEKERLAAIWWRDIGFEGRKEFLLQWRSVIT